MYTVLVNTLLIYIILVCTLLIYTVLVCTLLVYILVLYILIDIIFFFFYFDFLYVFLFFPEHIKNSKKKNFCQGCLNMIETKYRYNCVKWKIPGCYYSPNYFVQIYMSKIKHPIYPYNRYYFFLIFWPFVYDLIFYRAYKKLEIKNSCQRLSKHDRN